MALETIAPGDLAVSLAEVKALLRLDAGDEDALVAGFVRAATDLCERFTGRLLMTREVTEIVARTPAWRRLSAMPVCSIETVEALDSDGGATVLAAGDYAIDIDANGHGWVRIIGAAGRGRARIGYRAGLAVAPADLPEALRQGVVRLAAHLYLRRDDARDTEPPAVVTALWRPWRRLRLD
jgi:uncharacterized phiE125 gp8 family phage protein